MRPAFQRSFVGLLWAAALLGLCADQGSKYTVFRWLYDAERQRGEYEIVPGAFKLLVQLTDRTDTPAGTLTPLRTWSGKLLPHVNKGALFGLGNDYAHLANGFFAAVSLLAAVAIIAWSRRSATARDAPLCLALGLIMAGTLGNLSDRVVFGGVRDFLYFYWIEWPVFNVADCCLVCGAFLLLTQAFWSRPLPVGAPEPQTAVADPRQREVVL